MPSQVRSLLASLFSIALAVGCGPGSENMLEISSDDEGAEAGSALTLDPNNVIQNPSFEINASGWSCYRCTVASVASNASPLGRRVGRVSVLGSGDFSVGDWPGTQTTAAGQAFTASAFVRSGAESLGKKSAICLRERDNSGRFIATQCGTPVTLGTTFVPVTVSYTARGNGRLDMFVYQSPANANDSFDIDAVQLLKGSGAAPAPTPAPPTPKPESTPTPTPTPTSGCLTVDQGVVADLSRRSAWGGLQGGRGDASRIRDDFNVRPPDARFDRSIRIELRDEDVAPWQSDAEVAQVQAGSSFTYGTERWLSWWVRFEQIAPGTHWFYLETHLPAGGTQAPFGDVPGATQRQTRMWTGPGTWDTVYGGASPTKPGEWQWVAIGTKISAGSDGWYKVLVNGKQVYARTGRTSAAQASWYPKLGFYRPRSTSGTSVAYVAGYQVRSAQPAYPCATNP